MTTFDTTITGGTLVVPYVGIFPADIGVRNGKIATIAETGTFVPPDAEENVDATGLMVMPGAVDSHYHLGIYRGLEEDAQTETTSSTVGGVTSVISYFRTGELYFNRTGPYREIFPEVLDRMRGNSMVDYGFHLAPMTREHIAEIPWLVDEMGVSSFKYYMFYKGFNLQADSRDAESFTMSEDYDLGHLFEIMEQVASLDASRPGRLSVSLHCEHAELMRVFIERAKADPSVRGLFEYDAGRPPLTERLSVEEAGVLASATGVNVNFLHLSSSTALATATDVRRRYPGLDVNAEVTLHHLALACEDLEGRGLGGKVNPPIRHHADNEALWEGLRLGTVDTVASDHACCMEERKGDELWPAMPGFGGSALLYPVLLSEGHHKRNIPLTRIAEVASARPAETFNVYPRKGTIAVGSDADFAMVDLDREQRVTPELCRSAQDHTPFENVDVKGWPTRTMLRGRLVLDDGVIVEGRRGEYLVRS